MKKLLSFIVVMCAFFSAMAQNPMATLSHNGELTFFTNVGAFESAVNAAENGDIIYLSQGDFIVPGGEINISKRLSIVGNGYGSHIIGKINMVHSTSFAMDAPLFDGVRLYALFFNGSTTASSLGESEIRRCWIRELGNGCYAGKDVLYDKCFIEDANFSGSTGNNVKVQNSKVVKLIGGSNLTMARNCNISNMDYYPRTSISCILTASSQPHGNGSHSIHNSLLNFTPSSSDVYTHECYTYTENGGEGLLDDNMECTIDLVAAGYLGQDGTVVGIHGGEDPFSENPSVPTVDTDKSSVEYDAESNKLKVSITVKTD